MPTEAQDVLKQIINQTVPGYLVKEDEHGTVHIGVMK